MNKQHLMTVAGMIGAGLLGWALNAFTGNVDEAIEATNNAKIAKTPVVAELTDKVSKHENQLAELKGIAASLAANQATLIKNQDRIYDAIVKPGD